MIMKAIYILPDILNMQHMLLCYYLLYYLLFWQDFQAQIGNLKVTLQQEFFYYTCMSRS